MLSESKMHKLPNLDLSNYSDVEEYIIDFYKKLGWDGQTKLDPTKVKMNENAYKEIAQKLMDYFSKTIDDKTIINFLWMNYGPSGSYNNLKDGYVIVEEGAF